MSDPDSHAARLHRMLDEIIHAKTELKAADDKMDTAEERQVLSGDALQIFSDAADLLTELIDDNVSEIAFGAFPDTEEPDQFRWKAIDKLIEKLTYFAPILGAPNWHWWIENFLDELWLLQYGDKPSLLKPATISRGRKQHPGRKAFLHLQALQWLEFLNAAGISPSHRDQLVHAAYGERIDTIRKWESACRDVLGTEEVDKWLSAAAQTTWANPRFLETNEAGRLVLSEKGLEALKANGATYRECFDLEAGKK